jgi:TatD DNase family protein
VFDSHAHLDFPGFGGGLETALTSQPHVRAWFVPGYDVEPLTGEAELRRLGQGPTFEHRILWGVGLHPWRVAELGALSARDLDQAQRRLETRAKELEAVAIGETGFDRTPERVSSLGAQARAFKTCLELAQQLDLPLCLHNVRAEAELRAALRGVRLPSRPGVLHAFSGGQEFATWLIGQGFRLGIGLLLLRQLARGQETSLSACVRELPLESFVIETDATSASSLGALGDVATAMAELRGEPVERVERVTEASAREIFSRSTQK